MSNNSQDAKSVFLEKMDQLFDATEKALSEWQGEGNLQFPHLVHTMAVKLNWDDETMRKNDPIVRNIVRDHPDWYVTRGAHGGIMRRSEKDKKDAAKAAKELAKQQMKEAIEAKAASQQTSSVQPGNTPTVTE